MPKDCMPPPGGTCVCASDTFASCWSQARGVGALQTVVPAARVSGVPYPQPWGKAVCTPKPVSKVSEGALHHQPELGHRLQPGGLVLLVGREHLYLPQPGMYVCVFACTL